MKSKRRNGPCTTASPRPATWRIALLQLVALERVAELHETTGDFDRARRAIEEAIFLSQAVGCGRGVGEPSPPPGTLTRTGGQGRGGIYRVRSSPRRTTAFRGFRRARGHVEQPRNTPQPPGRIRRGAPKLPRSAPRPERVRPRPRRSWTSYSRTYASSRAGTAPTSTNTTARRFGRHRRRPFGPLAVWASPKRAAPREVIYPTSSGASRPSP